MSDKERIELIDKFIEDLYDLRKASIKDEGEYGIGNLVFKELRNQGILDKLKEKKNELVSKSLCLEKVEEDYHWKPSKAQKREFAQKMQDIDEFCKENNIHNSRTNDSYYFEINNQKYRVSNHSVEASNYNSDGKYHNDGRRDDTFYIHASKTRLIDIYNDLKNGYELDHRGNRINK